MTGGKIPIGKSLLYLLPIVVVNLISLLSLPIFTRFLTRDDFGLLALSQIYAILIIGLINAGFLQIYNRNFFAYRNDQRKTAELLYTILLYVSLVSSIAALLTFIFRNTLADIVTNSKESGELLFSVFIAAIIVNLKTYFLHFYRNCEDAKSFAVYSIADGLLTFLASLTLVVIFQQGVIGLIWGQISGGACVLLALTVKTVRILPIALNINKLREAFPLGLPLIPRSLLGVVNNQFDKYMLGLLESTGGVGSYSIGQRIVNVVFVYMSSLQNVFQPQVYKFMFDGGEKKRAEIGRYLTPFAYLSVFPALLVCLLAEEIVAIMTPDTFHDATDVVIILSMFYATLFFGKQPQLIYAGKTFTVSILSLFSVLLNIALNIPFIYQWGVMGAAWATLLAGLISGSVSFFLSQHHYRIEWEYKKIIAIYSVFFSGAIIMELLRHFDSAYRIHLLFKLVLIAIYLCIGIKINVLTRDNILSTLRIFKIYLKKEKKK